MNRKNNQDRNNIRSAKWTIDKNSGVIQVQWWVPLVIIGGSIVIFAISCLLICSYYKQTYSTTEALKSAKGRTTNNISSLTFANLKDAEKAYVDLYKQIDSFCTTVRSPE